MIITFDTSKAGEALGGLLHRAVAALGRAVAWAAKPALGGVIGAALVFGMANGCHLPMPTPPAPTPTPPAPVGPLVVALRTAYASDPDPDKASSVAALASLCDNIVPQAKASGSASTLAQLQKAGRDAADLAVGSGKLVNTRKAASEYVASKLPADDAPMTDALWASAASAYGDVAEALKQVRAK